MFSYHKGKCVRCQQTRIIVVKTGYCKMCNEFIKKSKKTPKPIMTIGEIKKMLSKPKRKPTGEMELFKKIWNDRPHNSQVSGTYIRRFDIRCFSHLLTKGAYPSFRLNPDNIWIVTPEEHSEWEFGDRSHPKFEAKRQKAEELKQKYYNEKRISTF